LTPRIAFVSREVFPFGGGGLGASVASLAQALSSVAEVTIVTTDLHAGRHAELSANGDEQLPDGVRFVFVDEPRHDEIGSHYNHFHVWSARVYETLKSIYPDGGPNLVEFPDFVGEGAVTVQAKATLDPALRHTRAAVRAYTSREMCDVLNRHMVREPGERMGYDLERYALRHAGSFLWPGGDVLGTYQRFYGHANLAPQRLIRHVAARADEQNPSVDASDRIRFIYVGRLERRKGVENLIRAATGLKRQDWKLTLLGGDTNTAPLGASMRALLELMVADDPRIEFRSAVNRSEMLRLIAAHDVSVYPSLWECWPFVALHSFEQNRPVIATPTGGFVEMVEPDVSGWLTEDLSPASLADALEAVLDEPDAVRGMIGDEGPRRSLDRLTDDEIVREQYLELASPAAKRRSRGKEPPLVSVIVPYHRMAEFVEETIRSAFEQTHPRIEVIVVNDGSFDESDWVLAELAIRYPIVVLAQQNSGLGAARNFGIAQSRGRYVFPLDADNVAMPTFVARCVAALEEWPKLAYVNSWVRYVDEATRPSPAPVEGHQPVTNTTAGMEHQNTAGDAAAVIRRRVFDLGFWYSVDSTSYEDWLFYRRLARRGFEGHAIPERLVLYRVRATSMVRTVGHRHHDRLLGEMEAELRQEETEWMPSSG